MTQPELFQHAGPLIPLSAPKGENTFQLVSNIEAHIFDMDGTILDSMAWFYHSVEYSNFNLIINSI